MNPKMAWILFALSLAALFWRLGERGLNEPDEGRCAGIAAEMYRSGDWVNPRLYNQGHYNKPPLLYWIGATLYRAGGINETTARLPATLAALATLLLTWLIGRRLFDEDTAFTAGLILLTSPLFFAMSRLIDPNMLLTCWVTLAMWAAVAWIQDGRRIHVWIFYIALALSFLTKGPVGIAIVALALAGYALRRPAELPWRNILAIAPFLVAAVAGLSWYVAVAVNNPDLYDFFLNKELYERVFTKEHNRTQPLLFYAVMIPGAVLPWLPSMLVSIRQSLETYRVDGAVRLLAAWIVFPTILFTLARSKMPTYILPLLPAIALLAARAILTSSTRPWFGRVQFGTVLAVTAALPVVISSHEARVHGWSPTWLAGDGIWLLPAAGGIAVALAARRAYRLTGLAILLLACYAACMGLMTRHELELGPHTTVRAMCRALQAELKPGDRVALLARHPRGLSFYLDQPITLPESKFQLQVPSDRERLKDTLFSDPVEAYRWFDSTQQVYLVTSDKAVSNMVTVVRTKPREFYRDDRYLVVRNFGP